MSAQRKDAAKAARPNATARPAGKAAAMAPATAKHIALLRAINVGGRTVRMEVLRDIFESIGFSAVETFIASGNVIFDAPAGTSVTALEHSIQSTLASELGYEVVTFLRTPAELAEIGTYEAFAAEALGAAKALYVGFLHIPPSGDAVRKVLALNNGIDEFHVRGRELYWLARDGMGVSKISTTTLERALGARTTTRNITTVRKLAAKYP